MTAVTLFTALALLMGLGLGFAAIRLRSEGDAVVDRIDDCLPQTQCAQCGYPGCRPYAQAIAAGNADINQCPPGGEVVIRSLAELLGRETMPLNPGHGVEQNPAVAVIDETACIGCALCIEACPVDAILGAARHMHTVIATQCTGCELCISPCPVDCIHMQPSDTEAWYFPEPSA